MKVVSPKFKKQREEVIRLLKTTDMTRKEIANKAASGNVGFVVGIEDDLAKEGFVRANNAKKKGMEQAIAASPSIPVKSVSLSSLSGFTPVEVKSPKKRAESHTYTIDEIELIINTKSDKELSDVADLLGVSFGALRSKKGRLRAEIGAKTLTKEEVKAIFLYDEKTGVITSPVIPLTKISRKTLAKACNYSYWTTTQAASFSNRVAASTRLTVLKKAKELYLAGETREKTQEERKREKQAVKASPVLAEEKKPETVKPVSAVRPAVKAKEERAISLADDLKIVFDKALEIAREYDEREKDKKWDEAISDRLDSLLVRRNDLLRALITKDRNFFSLTNPLDPKGAQEEYLKKCGFSDSEVRFFMNPPDVENQEPGKA